MNLELLKKHKELFGEPEVIVRSPGRANIIGEHTDYNDGLVLPFAIDKSIYFYATKAVKTSNIYSGDLDILEKNIVGKSNGFLQYFHSVLQTIQDQIPEDANFNLSFGGDLPIGAGVSSSSAITCGFIAVCQHLNGLDFSKSDIVRYAFQAERGAGVDGGMMDQFSIVFGESKKVICLDCVDKSWFDLDINTGDYEFVLINTHVQHQLADTAYNQRVTECKIGLQQIQLRDLSVTGFRDIEHTHLSFLSSPIQDRIKHVIEENQRVLKAVEFIKSTDMKNLGELLYASHHSLKDLYQVSCAELDYIVDKLNNENAVLGARMMGGGFGGCVIALVEKNSIDDIIGKWNDYYFKTFDKKPSSFSVKPESGLQLLNT